MSLPVAYWLADYEGTLCVVSRQADWNEPRYVLTYWLTNFSTRIICANYDVERDQLRDAFIVRQSMPGEYYVEPKSGYPRSVYLPLREGAKTVAIKIEHEPVPVPRVGKGTRREWESGRWRIYPPKGKPRTVTV